MRKIEFKSGWILTDETLKGWYALCKRENYMAWQLMCVQFAYRYY